MFVVLLWALNGALVLIALRQSHDVIVGSSSRSADRRRAARSQAIEKLAERDDRAELLACWEALMASTDALPITSDPLVRRILVIAKAPAELVDRCRPVFKAQVDALNGLGEVIDWQQVRAMDIARQHPDAHREILHDAALLEPFIWYESILQERGRWGYRVLQLGRIFDELRVVGPPSMWQETRLCVGDLVLVDLDRLGRLRRGLRRLQMVFHSPTIDVRGKVRQNDRRADLASRLAESGALPAPTRAAMPW